jgi:hypothetical protein
MMIEAEVRKIFNTGRPRSWRGAPGSDRVTIPIPPRVSSWFDSGETSVNGPKRPSEATIQLEPGLHMTRLHTYSPRLVSLCRRSS